MFETKTISNETRQIKRDRSWGVKFLFWLWVKRNQMHMSLFFSCSFLNVIVLFWLFVVLSTELYQMMLWYHYDAIIVCNDERRRVPFVCVVNITIDSLMNLYETIKITRIVLLLTISPSFSLSTIFNRIRTIHSNFSSVVRLVDI